MLQTLEIFYGRIKILTCVGKQVSFCSIGSDHYGVEMAIEGPMELLPTETECVDRALKLNDLEQLAGLFDNSELVLTTSNNLHNYFLLYSSYEYNYQLEDVQSALAGFEGSIFSSDGELQLGLRMHLPGHNYGELVTTLQYEIKRCFAQVFDERGQLQTWFADIFDREQLDNLYYQFGEAAVKFKCFELFAYKYCQLFRCYLSPADKICSDVLIELMKKEILAYKRVFSALSKFEMSLRRIDSDFKAKDKAEDVLALAKRFMLTNRLSANEKVYKCFESASGLILDPHNEAQLEVLNQLSTEIDAQTTDVYWKQFLGTFGVFIGSFLFVSGVVLAAQMAAPVMVTSALVTSGVGFFTGGGSLFHSGLPSHFDVVLARFIDKVQSIDEAYQNSLLTL